MSPRAEAMAAFIPVLIEFLHEQDPIPCRTSILTGAMYYLELLESRSEVRFAQVARMPRDTFLELLVCVTERGSLSSGRKVCAGEKLLIFLYIMGVVYLGYPAEIMD